MKVVKRNQQFEAVKTDDGLYRLKGAGKSSQVFTEEDLQNNFIVIDPPPVPAAAEPAPKLEGKMMLSIEIIPQDKQRYPTVGDWQFNDLGALIMKISEMNNPDYEFMVAIHEAVEAWICRYRGITAEKVDAWDMGEGKDMEDPGSHPDCPYHREHMLAIEIERMLCIEMGLDWDAYERKLADTCPTLLADGEEQEQ